MVLDFKVGDKVRIIRVEGCTTNAENSWVGKEGVIKITAPKTFEQHGRDILYVLDNGFPAKAGELRLAKEVKMKKELSTEAMEALLKSIKMWRRLAEVPIKKEDYLREQGVDKKDFPHWYCHLCEYVKERIGYAHSEGQVCLKHCPYAMT